MDDPFNLQRFINAQDPVYANVIAELKRGRKTTHWMWFVFPQIKGLGHTAMAAKFAISSRSEAEAYLAHPVLGPRLRECTQLVLEIDGRTANEIFGDRDDLKFRSCMTLFAHCAHDSGIFQRALQKYFAGAEDPLTLARL